MPVDPVPIAPSTTITETQKMIFKGKVDAYIKRESTLDENIQKSYSLILGQCTELLKSKLKQSKDWAVASTTFDVLLLITIIKSIVFRFDEQKFQPLALHSAKQNFYSFRQGNLSNAEYLEKFNNLVDIASAYDGEFHDKATLEFSTKELYGTTSMYSSLSQSDKTIAAEKAKEISLSIAFLAHSDKRRYGKLLEDLENDYTKGTDNYPLNIVKAYQLLSEYKHWQPMTTVPTIQGVAFSQKDNNKKAKGKNMN